METLNCRRVLSIMAIFCFMIQYMLRITMPITIVEMTSNNTSSRVDWTENQKNTVLGTFFFGYMLFGIPGGRLTEIYGPKRVMGTCILVASILTLLTPLACRSHYYLAVTVRLLSGLVTAVWFPALPSIATRWVLPKDRSKFVSHSVASTLGSAITLPISGILIAHLGWESVFYVTGGVAMVFSFFWFYLIYDSPQQHPRISEKELSLLIKEIPSIRKDNRNVPWRKLLTSGPVWAIVVSMTCMLFCWYFIFNKMPAYMKHVLNYKIEENGFLSSLPHLVSYFMAYTSSFFADKFIKTKRFSILTTRKIFTFFALVVPSLLFFVETFWGKSRVVSVIIFTSVGAFQSSHTAGILSNSLDIAPGYSATIVGMAISGGSLAGYLSTTLLGLLFNQEQTFERWQIVFAILGSVYMVGAIFFYIFASGTVQSWNSRQEKEMAILNKGEKEGDS